MPFAELGGVPRLVIPPAPGPHPGQPLRRRYDPPPKLTSDRHLDALYLLDTGVGLGFGHIQDGIDLLADHYGTQLRYVEDVLLEWRKQATLQVLPLGPGHSQQEKAQHDHLLRIRACAKRLLSLVPAKFGDPVDLGFDEVEQVDALVHELCALHPSKSNSGGDRGECATVRLGELLRPTVPVVVLCANDDRARRLASAHGIAHRNVHTVLREMVREGRLTAANAHAHYIAMGAVTQIPEWGRPTCEDDFC